MNADDVVGPTELASQLLHWDQHENREEPHAVIKHLANRWSRGEGVPLPRVRDLYLELRSYGKLGDASAAVLAIAVGDFLERSGLLKVTWADGEN